MRTLSPRLVFLTSLFLLGGCEPATQQRQELQLVQAWVNGNYNNVAQAEADLAANLPPGQMHRPMHQLFVPVEIPAIDGYLLYQQSTVDGSENPALIFRHGLMQYFIDTESGALIQRELYFKDAEPYKNAHQNLQILESITLDDMTWDAGCDFYLRANESGTLLSGPIVEKACVLFNQGLQKNMYADDLVEITENEYRFRGRFVDAEDNVLWGTESNELNNLQRQ